MQVLRTLRYERRLSSRIKEVFHSEYLPALERAVSNCRSLRGSSFSTFEDKAGAIEKSVHRAAARFNLRHLERFVFHVALHVPKLSYFLDHHRIDIMKDATGSSKQEWILLSSKTVAKLLVHYVEEPDGRVRQQVAEIIHLTEGSRFDQSAAEVLDTYCQWPRTSPTTSTWKFILVYIANSLGTSSAAAPKENSQGLNVFNARDEHMVISLLEMVMREIQSNKFLDLHSGIEVVSNVVAGPRRMSVLRKLRTAFRSISNSKAEETATESYTPPTLLMQLLVEVWTAAPSKEAQDRVSGIAVSIEDALDALVTDKECLAAAKQMARGALTRIPHPDSLVAESDSAWETPWIKRHRMLGGTRPVWQPASRTYAESRLGGQPT